MARKTTHTCERCGHETQEHYAGSFRDSDYLELQHDYFALEQQLRTALAREAYWQAACKYSRDELSAVDAQLADAYTDIGDRAARELEKSECPF